MAVYLTVDAALLTFVAVLLSGPQPARALPLPDKTAEERAWDWSSEPPLILEGEEREAKLPLGDKAASDRAWGWWEQPPYLAWTEEEPPLLLLEDEPKASPLPLPRPHDPYDSTFMQAVEDWTPRMKREYLREQRAARREEQREHVAKLMRERDERERSAMEALGRIGYWDMLKLGIATIPGWGDATPVPSPSPEPTLLLGTTDLGVDASSAVPLDDEWSWREYDYKYTDYDYEPPARYPSHDYDYDDVPPTPGWTHDYSESWSSHYDAEPGYEDLYPREPKLGEYPYDDYGAPEEGEEGEFDWMAARFLEWF